MKSGLQKCVSKRDVFFRFSLFFLVFSVSSRFGPRSETAFLSDSRRNNRLAAGGLLRKVRKAVEKRENPILNSLLRTVRIHCYLACPLAKTNGNYRRKLLKTDRFKPG